MNNKPQTLQQAIVHFADKNIAHQYLVDLRWSDGVVCPFCGGKEHSYLTTRKTWKCKACSCFVFNKSAYNSSTALVPPFRLSNDTDSGTGAVRI